MSGARDMMAGRLLLAGLLTAAGLCALAADGPVAEQALRLVAKHQGIFTAPPRLVPNPKVPDGPLLGNGDVGVVLAGPPEKQRWHIGKNDFWSRSRRRVITVGGLTVSVPALAGASYRQVQDILRAEVRGTFAAKTATLATRSWTAATENLLVIELSATGRPLEASLELFAGPLPGQRGEGDGQMAWFTRRADPPGTKDGRVVAVAARVVGAQAKATGRGTLGFVVEPGRGATLVVAILSDLDAKDPLSSAKGRLAALKPEDLMALNERHRAWWRAFWGKSFVEIGDPLIEKFWYGSHYIMASCSRAGEVPPGLFGNWVTTDNPAWKGDFHLNYNHEAPFWGLYSSNHVETAASYEAPILDYLPQARANARKFLGCRGVYYPVGIGPWGITSGGVFLGQKSNAAYAAVNMVMRFYSTWDLEYARKVAYPFLREVGDFWEDYLKFENGRYVDYNDAIHENHTPKDVNPLLSLGLIRMVFRALLDMSEALGVDADRRAKWQHILDHLSPYPTQERGGKTVFRYSERGQAWFPSNTLGIQHVWPAGAIGLGSDPKLLEIARNTHAALGRWRDFNGFPTFYTAAARLGIDPKLILTNLRGQLRRHTYPNLFIFYGGGGIECCSGVPTCIDEMLLQSHEGILRLFPCWPKDRDARFGNLRAYGAFLVSAELRDGRVRNVRIASEKGRPLTVLNPWPGQSVVVVRNGRRAGRVRGTRLTFATRPGEIIALAPGD